MPCQFRHAHPQKASVSVLSARFVIASSLRGTVSYCYSGLLMKSKLLKQPSCLWAGALLLFTSISIQAATFFVAMRHDSFIPPSVTIALGDTVTWVDEVNGNHDVENDSASGVTFKSPPPGTFQTFSFT